VVRLASHLAHNIKHKQFPSFVFDLFLFLLHQVSWNSFLVKFQNPLLWQRIWLALYKINLSWLALKNRVFFWRKTRSGSCSKMRLVSSGSMLLSPLCLPNWYAPSTGIPFNNSLCLMPRKDQRNIVCACVAPPRPNIGREGFSANKFTVKFLHSMFSILALFIDCCWFLLYLMFVFFCCLFMLGILGNFFCSPPTFFFFVLN